MSIRRLVVEVELDGLNVAAFCRDHGISRWLFYDLRRRHAVDGDAALEPKSRAPQRVANRTAPEVEQLIVSKRKWLADHGFDAGPGTIVSEFGGLIPNCPSEATVWRILKAAGFVTPNPAKAPKGSGKRFTANRANECWQLDDTTWSLADGSEVKILDVIDDHSRLLVASTATTSCTGTFAFGVLAHAATVLGWPAGFLSDNAKAFRHVLADALCPLGVAATHSRPRHPQTNGKVERFHQTLKRWLAAQPAAATIEELQRQLDLFRCVYNHQRPHRGINRRIPGVVWTEAPKSGPASHTLGTPTKFHTTKVARNGIVTAGQRYQISLGAAHAGQIADTVITGTKAHVFIDARLVRELTLDPSRLVQPMYSRPGHPGRK